jgi:hypothetical protein
MVGTRSSDRAKIKMRSFLEGILLSPKNRKIAKPEVFKKKCSLALEVNISQKPLFSLTFKKIPHLSVSCHQSRRPWEEPFLLGPTEGELISPLLNSHLGKAGAKKAIPQYILIYFYI